MKSSDGVLVTSENDRLLSYENVSNSNHPSCMIRKTQDDVNEISNIEKESEEDKKTEN